MERTPTVNPDCPNASNPFHQCAEYCSPRAAGAVPRSPAPDRSAQNGATSEVEVVEEEGSGSSRRKVDPLCVNASNPFHQCAEYCSPRTPGPERPNGAREISVSNGVHIAKNGKVDPTCVNASNPFHVCAEYCSQKKNENSHMNGTKSGSSTPRGSTRSFKTVERDGVDPNCVNASNPFHKCADYCLQKMNENNHMNGTKSGSSTPHGSTRSFKSVERDGVDPNCVNASNPFHKCADYCLQKMNENNHLNGTKSGPSTPHGSTRSFKSAERDGVDPNCVNASNPFHKCADYCLQKMNENNHMNGTKSGSSTPQGSKRSFKLVERDDVNPNCVNASNPFHKCADYCLQKMNGTL